MGQEEKEVGGCVHGREEGLSTGTKQIFTLFYVSAFLALSHLKQSNISQLQLQPSVLEGLPYMQDLVIDGVYRMGETALIVVSSRMTGTSLTSQEAVLKHLSPVRERKHLKPFERSGGDTPCLGRQPLYMALVSLSLSLSCEWEQQHFCSRR